MRILHCGYCLFLILLFCFLEPKVQAQDHTSDVALDVLISMQLSGSHPRPIDLLKNSHFQNELELSRSQRRQIAGMEGELRDYQIQYFKEQRSDKSSRRKTEELTKQIEESRSNIWNVLRTVQRKELVRIFARRISQNKPGKVIALTSNPETAKLLGLSDNQSQELREKWKKLDAQRRKAIEEINREFDKKLLKELPKKAQKIAKGWLKESKGS